MLIRVANRLYWTILAQTMNLNMNTSIFPKKTLKISLKYSFTLRLSLINLNPYSCHFMTITQMLDVKRIIMDSKTNILLKLKKMMKIMTFSKNKFKSKVIFKMENCPNKGNQFTFWWISSEPSSRHHKSVQIPKDWSEKIQSIKCARMLLFLWPKKIKGCS